MRGVHTKSKEKWKKLGLFVLLFLLLLVLANSVRKVYQKKRGAELALVRMEQEMQELEGRQEDLQDFAERLKTSEGLEFELRKKFNVAGAGESVALIVEGSEAGPNSESRNSFWQKIKDFVINLVE